MDRDILSKAKNIAFRLLKYRIRSEKELSSRLKIRKIPFEIISKVIRDLKELSLINDREFARVWVRESLRKGLGPLRIRMQLRQKGIEESLITNFLDNPEADQGYATIIEGLIKKRLSRYKDKDKLKIKRKLTLYLRSRGFSFKHIQQALEGYSYDNG